jgi:putative ABC transport system permease protein
MIPLIYSLNSIRKRYKATASIVAGVALFVLVFTMVQMLSNGIQRTVVRNSDPDTLVAVTTGADMEMASFIGEKQIATLLSLPAARIQEVLREFVIIKMFPKGDGKTTSIVIVRGVPANVYRFRKEFRLIAGRLPAAGKNEVLVGSSAYERLGDMRLGAHLEIAPHQTAEVVGIFQCADSSFDSELWGDLDMIRRFFGREGVVSSIRIRMNPADMPAFIREVKQSGLPLNLQPEPVFTRKQAERPKQFVQTIGMVLGFFIALASIIAVSTVMQTAVDGRKQEILLFRRMGFSAVSVVVAFFREAALLGLFGGIVGVFLSLFLKAYKTTIMNVGTWSQLVVGFTATGETILYSLVAGILAVVLGSSLPTLRMARQFRHSE